MRASCYLPVMAEEVEVGVDQLDHVLGDGGEGADHVDYGHNDQHLVQLGLRRLAGPGVPPHRLLTPPGGHNGEQGA